MMKRVLDDVRWLRVIYPFEFEFVTNLAWVGGAIVLFSILEAFWSGTWLAVVTAGAVCTPLLALSLKRK